MQCGAFVTEFFINTRKTEQNSRNQATQEKIRTPPPSTDYQNIKTSTQNIVKSDNIRHLANLMKNETADHRIIEGVQPHAAPLKLYTDEM